MRRTPKAAAARAFGDGSVSTGTASASAGGSTEIGTKPAGGLSDGAFRCPGFGGDHVRSPWSGGSAAGAAAGSWFVFAAAALRGVRLPVVAERTRALRSAGAGEPPFCGEPCRLSTPLWIWIALICGEPVSEANSSRISNLRGLASCGFSGET